MGISEIQQQYKYFAFISYSSKDAVWGRYLQKKLERYRLPARLAAKRRDAPTRAYPIFRDETDLSGFKVRDALERELEESRFLIVICSPKSAQSSWVNDEIRFFIDRGWENRILPFIVDGIPYSGDPDTECFPPALHTMTEDPLGVDVTALGKRKAFLRLVSALLDVKYDELLRRDSARRIRKGMALGLLGVLTASALGFGIWYNTEHSKLYNAVIYQNEIPVGLHELSKEEYAGANDTYRITKRRGKVVRLENVNSLGVVKSPDFTTPWTDYPLVEYLYGDDGALITVIQKDETGKEVFRKDLTVNTQTREIAIDFHSPANSLNAAALSADMSYAIINDQESDTRSEITRQRNTYDENGFLIRSLYQRDNLGTPACDSNGAYGKEYQYDANGQITRIAFLDENGNVFNCKYGYAYEVFTYDDRGNISYAAVLDQEGNQTRDGDGVFAIQFKYDACDNMAKQFFLDETGQLLDTRFVYTYTYDSQGFLTSYQFFHADGTPAHDEHGVHQHRIARDELGRNCGEDYYNTDGELFYSPGLSCAFYRVTLDEAGRMLTLVRYDTQGNPTCDPETGTYGMRCAYDENGYLCLTEYLDANGKPAMSKKGFASWSADLDSDGHSLRDEYRDEHGNLIPGYTNVAIAESEYDTFGNCIRRRVYDEKGEPAYHSDGYSSVSYAYEDGNLVSIRFFDTDGQPMLGAEYFHELRYDYDQAGNRIRWSYYDTEGSLVLRQENYAVMEKDYDRYGNVTANRFYDTDMEPVMMDGDLYAVSFSYDSRGNRIREEHFSLAPELMTFVVMESTYDDRGNVLSESYYMENGQPRDTEGKAARIECTYDNYGNYTEVRWLNASGEPKHAGSSTYVNLRKYTYDDFGQQVLVQHLNRDSSGKDTCLWQMQYSYDAKGNCIRSERLDGQGNLKVSDEGYAVLVQDYSPSGQVILEEYYDENNNPVLKDGTAFRYTYVRDAAGKILQMQRYGVDGDLLPESGGLAAQVCYTYDSRGNILTTSYFNQNGKPFGTQNSPTSKIVYSYDSMGNQTGSVAYDKQGNTVGEKGLYVYISDVYAGSAAEAAGISKGDFLMVLNDWELFTPDAPSRLHGLRTVLTQTTRREKAVILCRWKDLDEPPYFYRVQFPEGTAGYNINADIGNIKILSQMESAYEAWLKENP